MNLKIVFIIFGILISIAGILSIAFSNYIIRKLVEPNIKLVPSNYIYNQWLNPPVDIYMNFYLFNLKNPNEFLNGKKPLFEEIGPFVYREHVIKEDIVDNQNFTLTYKQRKLYTFLRNMSAYDDTHEITTINIAPISLAYNLKYKKDALVYLLNKIVTQLNETLIVTKTANELLFGYKDNLLAFLKKFNIFDHDLVPTDFIGLFFNKNYTIDGIYTIYTGADDAYKIGQIERYNYKSSLELWSSKYANMINGSDGTLFGPFIDKTKKLYVYNTDVCRSLYVNYNETIQTVDNIKLLGFKPDKTLFADNQTNPDNNGFCTPLGNCLGSGVLNISNCINGMAPIMVSNPHFLYADSKYVDAVDGLEWNVSQHLTSAYIEPITGLPFQANLKLQINIQLIKDSRISILKGLPEIIYPLYWCDENFKIDQKNADIFVKNVLNPLDIIEIGKYLIFSIGLSLLIIPILHSLLLVFKRKYNGYDTIISSNTHDEIYVVNEDERNFES